MATAFVDGCVFVGDGRVLERATVLVEGDRIAKVSRGAVSLPRGARKVPLDGCVLFPGFIDAHIHICLDGSPDPMAVLDRTSDPTLALRAADLARRTLLAGVTSVRDMGGKNGVDLAIRDAIGSGLIPGPRMLASARPVVMTGGHGWQMAREADGPHEVRKAAREQIKAGADLVKLMATGGVMTPGVEPGSAQFTEEELRAGIEEARKAGRRTATHAQGAQGILNALRAGIDSIEHGFYLTEEAMDLMVKRGVHYVPTLSALYHIETRGVEAGIPAFAVEKTLRIKSAHLDSVRRAREAGVQIAMGTDAGTPFNLHGGNLKEAELLVEMGGFSPLEALRAGTQVAAGVLGWEDRLGTVEAGKLADLVVAAGDPLGEIASLQRPESVRMVMKGGRMVKDA
jgi:imidazolonepropionase-like amidohydrolase